MPTFLQINANAFLVYSSKRLKHVQKCALRLNATATIALFVIASVYSKIMAGFDR